MVLPIPPSPWTFRTPETWVTAASPSAVSSRRSSASSPLRPTNTPEADPGRFPTPRRRLHFPGPSHRLGQQHHHPGAVPGDRHTDIAAHRRGPGARRLHPPVIDVILGLDVGKGEHHATAVTPAGKKALDKRLPNTEPKLRGLFAKLKAKHGTVLVVVDQPASIGVLPLAVARDMGCPVAYLPGLTMRRIADLYPGEAKTDAKDAVIIADAARAMPHTLRAIDGEDETIAELEMIIGFDDDLAGGATRVANRLHGLLTQIHPSLERLLGPR